MPCPGAPKAKYPFLASTLPKPLPFTEAAAAMAVIGEFRTETSAAVVLVGMVNTRARCADPPAAEPCTLANMLTPLVETYLKPWQAVGSWWLVGVNAGVSVFGL